MSSKTTFLQHFVAILFRVFKYSVEGLLVAIAMYMIPVNTPKMEEAAMVGLMAASLFVILDIIQSLVSTATAKVKNYSDPEYIKQLGGKEGESLYSNSLRTGILSGLGHKLVGA